MTSAVTLSYGAATVDFSLLNVTVTDRFNNPVIKIATPKQSTEKIGENTIVINLRFLNQSFDLSFQLTDGPGTFDFETPGSTNYEKIKYMAAQPNSKTLTLNGTEWPVQIEMVNIPWRPGQKNLTTNGTISCNVSKNITMG